MDPSQSPAPSGHSRNKSITKSARPRSSTKGPLDADDAPLAQPPPAASSAALRPGPKQGSRPTSPMAAQSPIRSSLGARSPARAPKKDFSFLLRPEIYHPLSPLNVPPPFRSSQKQPAPETPISNLLAGGHFRAAAIAAVQELTSPPATATAAFAHPPVDPTDHARIFALLHTRLLCLTLMNATDVAAQEARALEDLSGPFYCDEATGESLVPWELRVLAVRLQGMGFGDPRRAVMGYYELAREARTNIVQAAKKHDLSGREAWKARLQDLGVRVAGALAEMDDYAGAAAHLSTLKDTGDGRIPVARALLWLHLGDVDSARFCVEDGSASETAEQVVLALADMADGNYESAYERWQDLKEELPEKAADEEMVSVNMAVCLLYLGRMDEARAIFEGLVDSGHNSHTLLFNLVTLYELSTEKNKALKLRLAERAAAMPETSQGWEKSNADFKL